ncbi:hypothetical protein ACJMK2_002187 [Sinanodonta woodiana]|uniref:HMG box domain-containing protein n=1 Tax=Sinanodonta woodiana TaxID=1069815 RepID=A0ABD3XUG6_SINWO
MANASKRSHQDSSDSEEINKKRRYEEAFEEGDDEESDEEDEVEMVEVRNAQTVTSTAVPVKWTVEDSHRLLVSIMLLLPQFDVALYSEQEAQIDWEQVAFASFTADQCREHWHELTKKVRIYRTMSDMVTDALSMLPRPGAGFQMIQRNNQRYLKKPIPVKKKSTLPKLVMNAFSLFMKEKIQDLQHIPASERMKNVSQMYKLLSETEKNELMERYDDLKKNHIKELKKLKEADPALAEEVDEQLMKLEKIPAKSKQTKVSSVVSQNNSILKYMSKEKATPAQTVESSDKKSESTSGRSPKKNSSVKSASTPLISKKSESKMKSTMAAQEEDSNASNTSDDMEGSYLSSARSTKKGSPVKSASRPKKSKAVVEKQSLPGNSGSDAESDHGDVRKKPASKPQSTMATAEEDSGASDSSDNKEEEHKQRSKSPKKSHSAKSAEISPEKKSMQMTSLKPMSKPSDGVKTSESKRKEKKKKKETVTGLSQYVAAKKASYQQLYPELNDKEIAMRLAGKWERLSNKKKDPCTETFSNLSIISAMSVSESISATTSADKQRLSTNG